MDSLSLGRYGSSLPAPYLCTGSIGTASELPSPPADSSANVSRTFVRLLAIFHFAEEIVGRKKQEF